LFEEIGDFNHTGDCYNGIGLIYKRMGDSHYYDPNKTLMDKYYNLAIDCHKKALKIKLETGDKKGLATTYGSLGNVYSSFDKYDEALPNLLKALGLYKEMGYKDGVKQAYEYYRKVTVHKKNIKRLWNIMFIYET